MSWNLILQIWRVVVMTHQFSFCPISFHHHCTLIRTPLYFVLHNFAFPSIKIKNKNHHYLDAHFFDSLFVQPLPFFRLFLCHLIGGPGPAYRCVKLHNQVAVASVAIVNKQLWAGYRLNSTIVRILSEDSHAVKSTSDIGKSTYVIRIIVWHCFGFLD